MLISKRPLPSAVTATAASAPPLAALSGSPFSLPGGGGAGTTLPIAASSAVSLTADGFFGSEEADPLPPQPATVKATETETTNAQAPRRVVTRRRVQASRC